ATTKHWRSAGDGRWHIGLRCGSKRGQVHRCGNRYRAATRARRGRAYASYRLLLRTRTLRGDRRPLYLDRRQGPPRAGRPPLATVRTRTSRRALALPRGPLGRRRLTGRSEVVTPSPAYAGFSFGYRRRDFGSASARFSSFRAVSLSMSAGTGSHADKAVIALRRKVL